MHSDPISRFILRHGLDQGEQEVETSQTRRIRISTGWIVSLDAKSEFMIVTAENFTDADEIHVYQIPEPVDIDGEWIGKSTTLKFWC